MKSFIKQIIKRIIRRNKIERIISQKMNDNYKQIESLFSLFSIIKPVHPLPPMRGWAISPDFANVIFSFIKENKPRFILDLGSGVSTLIAGYTLKQLGIVANVLGVEHDEKYAWASQSNVLKHGLGDIVRVMHAPLKEVVINDKKWLWYDRESLKMPVKIDMLIVDGPPQGLQELSRYPAMPLLFNSLSERAVVLADDLCTDDMKEIIKLWLAEFKGFTAEEIDVEKGAAILRRSNTL